MGPLCPQPCFLMNKIQNHLLREQNHSSTVENGDGNFRGEQNTQDSSGKERVRQASYMVGRNVKLVWPLRRTVWRFLKKKPQQQQKNTPQTELPYDPAIPLLGIYLEKNTVQRIHAPHVHCGAVYNSQDMEAN